MATTVLELIEAGNVEFELQEVARLSGVHRTTIYRRWPDRASLIAEALGEHTARIDVQFTGDWRVDIRRMAFALRDFLSDPVEIAMNTLIATAGNAEFRGLTAAHWEPILKRFQQPLVEAKARREIRSETNAEMLIAMMIGPIISQIVFLKTIPDDGFIDQLVAQLINACA
ncbi:TetR-like C-terminal domain-containing protein [Cupriavidus basilensis]|uniref:TetR-like C-terminal domain-containing protein n=1 Tax=Cupriavidus sp. TaxID=1873897 RepID=UPI003D0A6746